MATSTPQATGTETIIAGYFPSGDDAHRAINALLDEGFLSSEIGAAFTSGGTDSTEASDDATLGGDTMREDLGTTVTDNVVGSDKSQGGPSSDTTAVQPVGLASGSGTPIYGAGKPGPISGSSLAHTGLPSELESELPHDQPGSAATPYTQASVTASTITHASPAVKADTSWTAKLKHLFGSKQPEKQVAATPEPSKESQDFGTGKGQLDLASPNSRPYSQADFESSVGSYGVSADHSRNLSSRLSTGGAVVTVSAGARATEVEAIFQSHNGVVRFASDLLADSPSSDYASNVEVFGHLEHSYPVR